MPEQHENEGWQEARRRIEEALRSNSIELDLRRLNLTTLPESISLLSNLRQLLLGNNQLTVLPESITQLSNLEILEASHNQITVIPESIGYLTSLEHLELSNNKLATIPEALNRLVRLENLHIRSNQITFIPESIGQFTKLNQLGLAYNLLTSIPDFFAKVVHLNYLDLHNNRLAVIPESLGQIIELQYLHLNNNQLTEVPESLGRLANLKILDLSGNRLSGIPQSLTDLTKLKCLFLHRTPGLSIPDEILGPTSDDVYSRRIDAKPPQEILDYIFSKSRPLNEAKLILVGQGGVGKTSLVNTLMGQKFKKGEETTEGIKIKDWPCPLNGKEKVTVHIWDFGGQEMMHATHQFFLTARSLYLLVLNRRPGGIDREADYWFRLVRAFAGKDAPVIVVLNKQKSEPFDVNRGGWLEKYAANIKGFVETDCEDAKSIKRLKKKIQEELQAMTSLKASFPAQWFAIKDELSHMSDQYVTLRALPRTLRQVG
jgi:internalin A